MRGGLSHGRCGTLSDLWARGPDLEYALEKDYARLDTLASIAKPMVIAVAVSCLVSATMIALYLSDPSAYSAPVLENYALIDIVTIVDVVILFASFFAVGAWIYRAHANLQQAELPGAMTSGGWALAWYGIPIANWFKPYQSMKELYQGSVLGEINSTQTAPGLIWTWWITWLLSSIGGFTGEYDWLHIASYFSTIVSALCLYVLIDRITDGQPTMSLSHTFE